MCVLYSYVAVLILYDTFSSFTCLINNIKYNVKLFSADQGKLICKLTVKKPLFSSSLYFSKCYLGKTSPYQILSPEDDVHAL